MNKYSFALFKEIQALYEEENKFSSDTKISDIFSENFNELSWMTAIFNLELIYGFEIPDSLSEQTQLTIAEFGEKLAALTTIPALIYPKFCKLKGQIMEDALRVVEIENGLEEGTQDEVNEINERLNALEQRLREITEFPLN